MGAGKYSCDIFLHLGCIDCGSEELRLFRIGELTDTDSPPRRIGQPDPGEIVRREPAEICPTEPNFATF